MIIMNNMEVPQAFDGFSSSLMISDEKAVSVVVALLKFHVEVSL
jgi:hypothetical protein